MSDFIIHGPPEPNFKTNSKGMGSAFLEKLKANGDKIAQVNLIQVITRSCFGINNILD